MVTPPGIPDEKVRKMKPSFKARYGDRWKEVLYATLWKHKGSYQEETIHEQDEPTYAPVRKDKTGKWWAIDVQSGHAHHGPFETQHGAWAAHENWENEIAQAADEMRNAARKERQSYGEETIIEQRRPIHQIARDIRKDWKKPYFGAVPYLNAMHSLESTKDNYYADSGKSVVAYFLGNANTYRGENARKYKQELKDHLKEETINENQDDRIIKGMENYAKGNVRANWMKGFEKPGPEFQELINQQKNALAKKRKEQIDADRNLKNYQDGNVRANWRKEETIIEKKKDPDWEPVDPKDERIGDESHKPRKKKQLKEIIGEAEKSRSWNPPEVQAKAAKFKKEQKMFDSALKEINRERKKEGLKRTTADEIRREYNLRYQHPSENPTPPAIGKWEYEHIRKGKPIK